MIIAPMTFNFHDFLATLDLRVVRISFIYYACNNTTIVVRMFFTGFSFPNADIPKNLNVASLT